jgi:hypothetical protein
LTLAAGWAHTEAEETVADAVIAISGAADPTSIQAALSAARSAVKEEGMVALVVPSTGPGSSAGEIAGTLDANELRLVDLTRPGRSAGRWVLALARRKTITP